MSLLYHNRKDLIFVIRKVIARRGYSGGHSTPDGVPGNPQETGSLPLTPAPIKNVVAGLLSRRHRKAKNDQKGQQDQNSDPGGDGAGHVWWSGGGGIAPMSLLYHNR
jgi:hypothetical protein